MVIRKECKKHPNFKHKEMNHGQTETTKKQGTASNQTKMVILCESEVGNSEVFM